MRYTYTFGLALGMVFLWTIPAFATSIYNNLNPNGMIAAASRPSSTGAFEIETADDFLLGHRPSSIPPRWSVFLCQTLSAVPPASFR